MLQSGLEVKIYDTPAGGICASHGTFSSWEMDDNDNLEVSDNMNVSFVIIHVAVEQLIKKVMMTVLLPLLL